MKVKIGKYPTHRWYHNFLYKLGIKNEPKVSVHIDDFDTWSMDHTLAYIIVPMLKQLKETKQGAPYVYLEDVPSELRPTKEELTLTGTVETDSKFFDCWNWVLDEMIFAFESKHNDWEEQFHSGEVDRVFKDLEKGCTEWLEVPSHTFKIDMKGRKAYQDRISNGFRLFGKYYENLWY